MNSFYSPEELAELGIREYGENVQISRKASIYGGENLTIGSHVRIDDFCILSGKITLGSYIHISAYTALYGGEAGITLRDYSGISARCAVYAISDDFSGLVMTNSTIPLEYRRVISGPVLLESHVIVGTGSTILPNVTIGEGAAVGSMSFVNKDLEPWGIYSGVPCVWMKSRSNELLEKEKLLRAQDEKTGKTEE